RAPGRWAGPAGDRAAVGIVAFLADPRAICTIVVVAGPAARRDVSGHAGMAPPARPVAAGFVHRGRPALGRCIDPGIPRAVPGRGLTRPDLDRAYVPPGIQDTLAGGRSPDQPGSQSSDAEASRPTDAAADGARSAGGARRGSLRPDRWRALVRRGIH